MSRQPQIRRSLRLSAKGQPKQQTESAVLITPPRRCRSQRTRTRDSLSVLPGSPEKVKDDLINQENMTPFASFSPKKSPVTTNESILLSLRGTPDPLQLSTPCLSETLKDQTSTAIVSPDTGNTRISKVGKRQSSFVKMHNSKGVRFGTNSLAKFHRQDPPSHIERMYHPNVVMDLLDSDIELDDMTRRNSEYLAQWDNFFDDISMETRDDDSEDSLSEFDGQDIMFDEKEIMHLIAISDDDEDDEEENFITAKRCGINKRQPAVVRQDVVWCKFCKHGAIRSSMLIYE